jgi:hypothetical protein
MGLERLKRQAIIESERRSPMTRVLALLAVFIPLSASAAAQPAPLTSVTATWTEHGKVELAVTFEGSACEEPGEPHVAAGDDITDEVTIPTVSTAEVCTMQIVPVEFTGTIAVEPLTERLAIAVLDTEGQIKAAGSVEIMSGDAS